MYGIRKKSRKKFAIGAVLIIAAVATALILGLKPLNVANYTPSGGTACWHIDGNWSYVWYQGPWDAFISQQNRRMIHINPQQGLHVVADTNYYVVYNQFVKADGCYSAGANSNVEMAGDQGAADIMESQRPFITGVVLDNSKSPAAPMAGATVMCEGKTVQTDGDGRYTIYIDSAVPQTIIASMTGYKAFNAVITPNSIGMTQYDLGLDKIITCNPSWVCTGYSACAGSQQTRTCTDGCGATRTESQACQDPTPPECTVNQDCASKAIPDGSCPGTNWQCVLNKCMLNAGPDCTPTPQPEPTPTPNPTPSPDNSTMYFWLILIAIVAIALAIIYFGFVR